MRSTNLRVISAPNRYVQGRDATYELASELKSLGITGTVGIIAGKTSKKLLTNVWKETFEEANLSYILADFQGESSRQEVDRLAKLFQKEKVTAIIGAGGGKTLDTARAVAEVLSLSVIICPSNASNDSPCFSLSVMYSPSGEYEGIWYMQKSPLLVLVDTTLIAKGPERQLAAGMADALATYIESRACSTSGARNLSGGRQTLVGECIAKTCFETILANGREALDAVKSQSVTPALEKVVEANILLSGVGCESTGVACAHAVQNGLSGLKETHDCLHGEKVSFGLVTQLMLEGAPSSFIHEVVGFLVDTGLPVTFAQLGISNLTDALLLKIAKKENVEGGLFKNEPFLVTDRMIVDAMKAADTLGQRYLQERASRDEASSSKWRKSA